MKSSRAHFNFMKLVILALFSIHQYVWADESKNDMHAFIFASGYQGISAESGNILEYGVVKRCGNAWCMKLNQFDSALMLPREPTKFMHEMSTPYRSSSCVDGPIHTIRPSKTQNIKVSVHQENGKTTISDGKLTYHWKNDTVQNGYILTAIQNVSDGKLLSQSVGFAFESDHILMGDVKREQIDFFYNGQIHHKTAFTGAAGDWIFSQSSIDFRKFQSKRNSQILSNSQAGDPSIIKKYGKQMWVQNSIILTRTMDIPSPLIQEYGHDFDMDGCFNESGHNKLMLPIENEGKINSIVYIEYTSDFQRGFPMLSVGRYYR
jgi:hypothetical protein